MELSWVGPESAFLNQRGKGQFNRSCDSHMTIYLGVIVDDCVTHYVIAGRPGERERPPPPMVVLCREGEKWRWKGVRKE